MDTIEGSGGQKFPAESRVEPRWQRFLPPDFSCMKGQCTPTSVRYFRMLCLLLLFSSSMLVCKALKQFRCLSCQGGAILLLITALHGMQTRSSDENSVRLSVRPSVCLSVCVSVTRVHCDKTVERSVQIYTPYERSFILVF